MTAIAMTLTARLMLWANPLTTSFIPRLYRSSGATSCGSLIAIPGGTLLG